MKKILLPLLALCLMVSCRKHHDGLYGATAISGIVTDLVSGQALPQAEVRLYKVRLKSGLIGKTAVRDDDYWLKVTTDADGHYRFDIEASGEYAFDLEAEPESPLYVSSAFTAAQSERVEHTGGQSLNIACNRSAWARVTLTNTGVRDTSYSMALRSSVQYLTVFNFHQDTTIYLKLVGNTSFRDYLRLNINDQHIDETRPVAAAPWDTLSMQFNF